jgi:hypothetical protein
LRVGVAGLMIVKSEFLNNFIGIMNVFDHLGNITLYYNFAEKNIGIFETELNRLWLKYRLKLDRVINTVK